MSVRQDYAEDDYAYDGVGDYRYPYNDYDFDRRGFEMVDDERVEFKGNGRYVDEIDNGYAGRKPHIEHFEEPPRSHHHRRPAQWHPHHYRPIPELNPKPTEEKEQETAKHFSNVLLKALDQVLKRRTKTMRQSLIIYARKWKKKAIGEILSQNKITLRKQTTLFNCVSDKINSIFHTQIGFRLNLNFIHVYKLIQL